MTERLRDDQLDDDIRRFLAWQAEDIADAPTATEVAMRITAPRRARSLVPGVAAQLAWLPIAALLAVALIGAAVVGANLVRDDRGLVVVDPTASYEAVFLRRDPSTDVLVIAVNAQGRERVVTRLEKAWSNVPTPAPAGVISPSGLLVMPTTGGLGHFGVQWKVYDVLSSEAKPIVIPGIAEQDTDQLNYWYPINTTEGDAHVFSPDARAWWGPGDRLAIHWYERIPLGDNSFGRNYFVTFADGATGEATSVDISDARTLLPYWAPDGSGIFVDIPPDGRVLRADGTLAPAIDPVEETSCHRLPRAGREVDVNSAEAAACLSPDDLLVARSAGPVDRPTGSVTVEATGESFDVMGRFAGWLEVHP
jgi:hypothetical protein